MRFPAFFESGITGFCLLVVMSQIHLRHESVIHDIVPITDKKRFQAESCKESAPYIIASFAVDIDDLIIGDLIFPCRERMQISQIIFKEICISLTFHHDDLVDEKYLGQVLEF